MTRLETDPGDGHNDVAPLFDQASTLFRNGRLAEAKSIARRILADEPKHAQALHLLGVVLSQQGNHSEGLSFINAALQIEPESASLYNSRGNVLVALRRFDEALANFETAIALKPQAAFAFGNRGNLYQELGRLDEAIASYDKQIALDPDDAEAFYNRGGALHELKRFDEAVASYDKAIALRCDYAEAFSNRGTALQALGRHAEAVTSYDQAIAIKPNFPEALCNRGSAFHELKRFDEAISSCNKAIAFKSDFAEAFNSRGMSFEKLRRLPDALASFETAIALKSDYAEAYDNRGSVLKELKRLDEALASCDRAIALKPGFANAFNNRGIVLFELQCLDEALASYDRAIAIKPDFAEALSNRGNILQKLKRLDEALASFNKAISVKTDYSDGYHNRALCRLLAGQYKEGWADYEWRCNAQTFPNKHPNPKVPFWQGEDLVGCHLLVFWEMGLGDVIQFVRYLPVLVERKCKITFLAPANLTRLLRPSIQSVEIVSDLTGVREVDFQVALMSLPHRLTELSSIPNQTPYLRAEPELEARWKAQIGAHGFKIGIAWQGNPRGKIDEGRSIPLEQFVPLSRLSAVRLISLQKHFGLDQLAALSKDAGIESLGDAFDSGPDAFIDTAAVMASLDLIITSDTSIAHLAGALERPTWVALKHVPDWRWLLDREDSPWYPTVRLFRQPRRDDWASVFAKIEQELKTRARLK